MKSSFPVSRLVPLLALPGCAVPSGAEILIIGAVVLLLFGGAKLPGLMRSMGSGINEFKKGLKEGEGGDDEGDESKKELNSTKD